MKRWLVLFTVLSLLLLVLLQACGGDDGEKTQTATATTTVTATPATTPTVIATATTTPASSKPVKIGAIYPRSGQMAMVSVMYDPIVSLVEWQVKNQGGILGGREVKFIKGDDAGVVAQAAAQAKKLILEDKVVALTFGGISAASFNAVADVADELKVPYVALAAISGMVNRKYCADVIGWESNISSYASHVEFLKPTKLAFLLWDLSDAHYMMDGIEGIEGIRDRIKAAGIDIVYEQYYPVGTQDFSAYITKFKYANPDLIFASANDPGTSLTILKQITELGGLGNMKIYWNNGIYPAMLKKSETVGNYARVDFVQGSAEPGMKAFEDAYVQKYGKQPDSSTAIGYNCFWTAIKAMEMAGTDAPDKVAQALRSGNLEWDSAYGPLHFDSNGDGLVKYTLVQVQEGGKLVKVWP